MLIDVPLALRRNVWFMRDGAPLHFSLAVCEYLNRTFGNRWIGERGLVAWPYQLSDLDSLVFLGLFKKHWSIQVQLSLRISDYKKIFLFVTK